MFCIKCGNELKTDASFCHQCGEKVHVQVRSEKKEGHLAVIDDKIFEPSAATPTSTPTPASKPSNVDALFYVPFWKFAFLSVITLGFYTLAWMYRNWEYIMKQEKSKISPLGRSIFAVFYVHVLFKKIKIAASEKGFSGEFNTTMLGWVYIISTITTRVLDRASTSSDYEADSGMVSLLGLAAWAVSIWVFLPVLKVVEYNNAHSATKTSRNEKFSTGEIVAALVGGVIWIILMVTPS